MATVHRPAPLPPRAGQPSAAPTAARKPLPDGAVAWNRTYLDDNSQPCRADYPVPVDANGHRTPHQRHTCHETVTVDGGDKRPCDSEVWLLPGDRKWFCSTHGGELVADKPKREPLLPIGAVVKSAEPYTRPLWVLLAELAAGIGEHVGHVPWWQPAVAAPALTGGAWWATKAFLTGRAVRRGKLENGQMTGRRVDTIRRRARSACYTATAGSGWLALAAGTDPHSVAGKVAWCSLPLWYAATAPTWTNYVDQLRNRPEPTPPAPAVLVEAKASPDEAAAADAAKTWDEEVGLPGTKLDVARWWRTVCGWQAVIVATKRGALNQLGGENMKGTVRRVAAAFDVPKSAVTWIEEHEDSPNQVLLLVQPNNPLKRAQVWGGPDTIRITKSRIEADTGRLIDGTPMVETLFKFGWGAPSELVLGTTGGGKSARARKRLVMERWATFEDPATRQRQGLFLSFLHDPKRLESYAEFRNAVHGYGITRDDAHLMIDAFLREMFRRYDMLALHEWHDSKNRPREGGIPFDPRIHGPIISCYWDEFHALADDKEFVKKLEQLARFQRACGMRATLLSHMGTLGDTGSQALRDMLAGGRATLFRTTSALNSGLATGGQLTGDPRALAKDPGMCLVADGETATLEGRESFVPNDDDAETMGERSTYDWMFDDRNQPIGYPADIPKETAEAFGKEFMEWMAAGRQKGGRPVSRASRQRMATVDTANSADVLRQIMFGVEQPIGREKIAAHPRWTWGGVTSTTLGNALRKAQDDGWLVKVTRGNGVEFQMTEAERERVQVERDELVEAGQ